MWILLGDPFGGHQAAVAHTNRWFLKTHSHVLGTLEPSPGQILGAHDMGCIMGKPCIGKPGELRPPNVEACSRFGVVQQRFKGKPQILRVAP